MRNRNLITSVLLAASGVGAGLAQPRYTVTELSPLPGYDTSSAFGVNEAGQVVGACGKYFPGGAYVQHATLWDGGSIIDLGTLPGGVWSVAYRINNSGQIVGQSEYNPDGFHSYHYGFRYDIAPGSMTALVTGSSCCYTDARCINDLGWTGGLASHWINDYPHPRATVWTEPLSTFYFEATDVNSRVFGLNNTGMAVGKFPGPPAEATYHAFVWDGTTMTDISIEAGLTGHSGAFDVNEAGQVVGFAEGFAPYTSLAFLWEAGVLTNLDAGHPTRNLSQALAINNNGQIVGNGSGYGHLHWDAILWQAGTSYWLQDLLPPGHGWDLFAGSDISDNGTIVGTGDYPAGQQRGFVLKPRIRSMPVPQRPVP